MRDKYHELSLAKKFSLFSIILIVSSIMIFTVVIRWYFEKSVLEITSEGYQQKFDIASESSQDILNDAEKISKVLLTDDSIQDWFLNESQDTAENLNLRLLAERRLDYLDALYPYRQYSSISVYNSNGNMVNTNTIRAKSGVYQQFFDVIKENADQKRWIDLYQLEIPDYEEKGIAYIRYFRDYSSGKIMGYVMIEYRSELLVENFTHIKYGENGSYMIVDQQGNVKIENDQASTKDIGKESFFQWAKSESGGGRVFRINEERYLITTDTIPKLGWIMIGITPVDELTRQVGVMSGILYLVGLIAILFCTYFSFRTAHSVTRPLTELADTMERFGKGELTANVPVIYKDEIGMLSEEFNKMAQQIRELVNQVYREQKEKRKSELAALQAQINPHFLYNTLNSVSSLIRTGCQEEAFTMIHAIGMFYRTSLSDGKTLIPVEQELTNIENYIQIQKFRYGDKIEYDIEISPEIMKEWIVKLTLQPLVENSIYHGIKEKRGKGRIEIRGWKEENEIFLSVADNGLGIPTEKMEHLLDGEKDGKRYSYGLYNIQQRLQLYFGKEYGITIESWLEEGTKTTIRIPSGYEKEEQNEGVYRR